MYLLKTFTQQHGLASWTARLPVMTWLSDQAGSVKPYSRVPQPAVLPPGLAPGQAKPDAPRYTPDVPTTSYVLEALNHMHVDAGIVKSILHPDREVTVQLPVALDSGNVEMFSAHLVQHNNSRGPFKGGLIFHQDVTLEGLRNLAALNTWKTALMDVPFGGAKMGVAVDPRTMSAREQEKITRKMLMALQQLLGPTVCVPAPDIGTDERHMSWIFDQYSRIRGYAPAVVSGKPVWLHGCQGRDIASGRGAALIAREFMRKVLKKRVAGSKFLIQGFGKNGSAAAALLDEMGGKVIGVSSSETAVFNEIRPPSFEETRLRNAAMRTQSGLDIKSLRAHVAAGKYLAEFPGGQSVSKLFAANSGGFTATGNDAVVKVWASGVPNDHTFLEIPCDVLLPAAVAGTINSESVPKLNCSAVVEAANSGITPNGNKALTERGIPVCPDILVTGGGVVVSFFEWVQNINNLTWDAEEILRKQESYMIKAFEAASSLADSQKLSLRTAAYCVALERIARADDNRGHG